MNFIKVNLTKSNKYDVLDEPASEGTRSPLPSARGSRGATEKSPLLAGEEGGTDTITVPVVTSPRATKPRAVTNIVRPPPTVAITVRQALPCTISKLASDQWELVLPELPLDCIELLKTYLPDAKVQLPADDRKFASFLVDRQDKKALQSIRNLCLIAICAGVKDPHRLFGSPFVWETVCNLKMKISGDLKVTRLPPAECMELLRRLVGAGLSLKAAQKFTSHLAPEQRRLLIDFAVGNNRFEELASFAAHADFRDREYIANALRKANVGPGHEAFEKIAVPLLEVSKASVLLSVINGLGLKLFTHCHECPAFWKALTAQVKKVIRTTANEMARAKEDGDTELAERSADQSKQLSDFLATLVAVQRVSPGFSAGGLDRGFILRADIKPDEAKVLLYQASAEGLNNIVHAFIRKLDATVARTCAKDIGAALAEGSFHPLMPYLAASKVGKSAIREEVSHIVRNVAPLASDFNGLLSGLLNCAMSLALLAEPDAAAAVERIKAEAAKGLREGPYRQQVSVILEKICTEVLAAEKQDVSAYRLTEAIAGAGLQKLRAARLAGYEFLVDDMVSGTALPAPKRTASIAKLILDSAGHCDLTQVIDKLFARIDVFRTFFRSPLARICTRNFLLQALVFAAKHSPEPHSDVIADALKPHLASLLMELSGQDAKLVPFTGPEAHTGLKGLTQFIVAQLALLSGTPVAFDVALGIAAVAEDDQFEALRGEAQAAQAVADPGAAEPDAIIPPATAQALIKALARRDHALTVLQHEGGVFEFERSSTGFMDGWSHYALTGKVDIAGAAKFLRNEPGSNHMGLKKLMLGCARTMGDEFFELLRGLSTSTSSGGNERLIFQIALGANEAIVLGEPIAAKKLLQAICFLCSKCNMPHEVMHAVAVNLPDLPAFLDENIDNLTTLLCSPEGHENRRDKHYRAGITRLTRGLILAGRGNDSLSPEFMGSLVRRDENRKKYGSTITTMFFDRI